MKMLSCKDMGAECDFVAKGETNQEVMKAMMDHAQAAHPDKMKEMETKSAEEVQSMMMGAMKEM